MFKQVCLLTRKPGMTMAEFKAYYEGTHAPLLASMMPLALRYVRRFVQPEIHPFSNEPMKVPFDCMMELWWKSRAEFEQAMAALGEGGRFEQIYADEEKIFASHDNPGFSVEEFESPMRGFADLPALGGLRQGDGRHGTLKLVFLLKRKPGMTQAEFRDYYESRHRKLAETALANALRYVRRFVHPERNPITGEVIELPFDAIMEIWMTSRAEWNETQAGLAGSAIMQAIYEDEEQLFASHENPMFTVEEADSRCAAGSARIQIGKIRLKGRRVSAPWCERSTAGRKFGSGAQSFSGSTSSPGWNTRIGISRGVPAW